MAELEKRVRKRRRKENIQKIVLGTVKATGLLSVALIAPNAVAVLAQIDPSFKKRRKNPRYTVNNAVTRLRDKGFIATERRGGKSFIRLTQAGEEWLRRLDLGKIHEVQKKKRWDKKWRIIIFDIAEEKRIKRDSIRNALIQIGFYRLQNSVWVYPYDCEGLITMIKTDFKIGKEVLYIIADAIENDLEIRTHFGIA